MCVPFSLEVLQAGAVVNRAFPLYKDKKKEKKLQVFFQTMADGVFCDLVLQGGQKARSLQAGSRALRVRQKEADGGRGGMISSCLLSALSPRLLPRLELLSLCAECVCVCGWGGVCVCVCV